MTCWLMPEWQGAEFSLSLPLSPSLPPAPSSSQSLLSFHYVITSVINMTLIISDEK